MKVAVCLYGYPRNYELGHKSLSYFLEGIDYDFFIHSWCDKTITDDEFKIIHKNIESTFNPKKFILQRQIEFKSSFDFEFDSSAVKKEFTQKGIALPITLSPMFSMMQSSNLLEESNKIYDLVINTRFDVFCSNQLKNYQFDNFDDIYSSHCNGEIWDLNNKGEAIDTKMIMSNQENMIYFMKVYNYVESYLKEDKIKLCHHRLFAHHLRKLNKKFYMIFNSHYSWYFIRDNGELEGDGYQSNIINYSKIFSTK